MKLQQSSIIETPHRRMVEMLFSDVFAPEEHEAQIRFVVPLSAEGSPRTPEAQLVALRVVRNVISVEIQRLEDIHGREHPGEDWQG